MEENEKAPIAALYTEFVNACTVSEASNTVVAQTSIMMLTDALTNMCEAHTLPGETFNALVTDVVEHLMAHAMSLSGDIAAIVAEIKNPPPPGDLTCTLADPPASDAVN
jgi:hypothetical protein